MTKGTQTVADVKKIGEFQALKIKKIADLVNQIWDHKISKKKANKELLIL